MRHTKDKKDEEKGCYFYCVEVPKLICPHLGNTRLHSQISAKVFKTVTTITKPPLKASKLIPPQALQQKSKRWYNKGANTVLPCDPHVWSC